MSLRFPKGSISNINFDTLRNYSLSCGENSNHYRITVKQEADMKDAPGIVSNHLHTGMQEGDELEIGMPCGTFNLKENERDIVLIGGGIGVTPMMSFLQTLISIKNKTKIFFIHCVKNSAEHVFAPKVDEFANKKNIKSFAFYSRPTELKLHLENTKINHGRITENQLKNSIKNPKNCDFYICGPPDFTKNVLKMLENMEVPKEQISYEYFGPQLQ